MAKMNLLIHIGYHRTGTTWLQKHLFKNQASGFAPLDRRDARQRIVLPHALDFEPNRCKTYFRPVLQSIIDGGSTPVLSMERLCGSPHSGGYDSKEIADRLAQVFPAANILLVIREQKSMILSTYAQYVRAGGPLSLTDYLQPPTRGQAKIPLFDFTHFKYHRLIQYYISLFGKSNVLVLPYELFRLAPLDFVQTIAHFSELQVKGETIKELSFATRENKALSGVSLALKRRMNLLVADKDRLYPGVLFSVPGSTQTIENSLRALDSVLPRSLKNIARNRSRKIVSELVGEQYKTSNRLCAQMLDLDLKQYGYAIAER